MNPALRGIDLAAAGSEDRTVMALRDRHGLFGFAEQRFADDHLATFCNVPIRVVDNLTAGEISMRPGAVNYASYAQPTMSRLRLANERNAQANAMAEMLRTANELMEGMSQQLVETILYGSDAPDPAARQEAKARAETLLREWLSPAQLEELETHNYFHVVGGDSGKRYRITRGRQLNVIELDTNGEAAVGRCFVPAGALAEGDIMLGQKIALETRERDALKKANPFEVKWRSSLSSTSWAGTADEYNCLGYRHVMLNAAEVRRRFSNVEDFQATQGIAVDGIAGRQTLAALCAHEASSAAAAASAAAMWPAIGDLSLLLWTIGLCLMAAFLLLHS